MLRRAITLDHIGPAKCFPHIRGGICRPDRIALTVYEQRSIRAVELGAIVTPLRPAAEVVGEPRHESLVVERTGRVLVDHLDGIRGFIDTLARVSSSR